MITVRVMDREANAIPRWPITSGSVGLSVSFTFDDAWDGLAKTAVFRGSGETVDVVLVDDACAVPAEVLTDAGDTLWIGVHGANGAGTIVIPTIWAKAGYIYEGTEPSGVDPAEPTPSWAAQVQAAAASALQKAGAVETAAQNGDFDGEDGVSPTVAVTDITGGHRVTITDAEGDHQFDVMDGADGADGQDGTDGIDGQDGQDGQDGVSPTVTITAITGGHRVTITDAEHPSGQSFDVMDGEDGGGSVEEVFWATYGTTTNAQIEAAYQAGKIVMCLYNGYYVLRLTYRSSANVHRFSAVTSGRSLFWAACENDSWTNGSEPLAPAHSPYLTGTPKAPTAASGTNTTQIATTAFVQTEVEGKYTKPSGGIPKADLASAVQASLDKADTALQGDGLSDDVKQALLQLAQKVAYIDAHGSDYYQDLYDALYPSTPIELTGITATFTQGTHTIFDTDSLDDLKPYLTVTANYSDSSSAAVTTYTLSGTLTAGTSTITVTYQGKTATFTVTVSHTPVMTGITATFNQGSATIYDTDSLDSLKTYLTVTADYDTGASSTVTNYTLSGTLAAGSSTIIASYGGFTDSFNVTVTQRVAVLESITASFSQGSATIYDDDSLNSLKQYLTVTAHYSDSTSAAVSDYTLSGTLSTGASTITVTYNGKTDTFNVTVTHRAAVYTVSNTLEHCTSSNAATSATEGSSYSATITAAQGYTLTGAAVLVQMDSTDITSTAYSNGVISIANVTGNISISVSAAQVVLSSISASYTQSGTVYDNDTLDSLKAGLVVTATYSDSSTETVPSADYSLSGTLTEGTSTITVSYGGKTTTFNVTVTHNPYWLVLSIADDFVEGTGTGGSWSDTYGGYFVKNTNRCSCSVFLNHVMELGYKYTFECNISNNKNFGVPYYKAAALTAVQNHQGIGGSAGYFIADPGWKTNGYVFTPPEDCIAQIQFNATQAALLAAGITELRIIKEAVS